MLPFNDRLAASPAHLFRITDRFDFRGGFIPYSMQTTLTPKIVVFLHTIPVQHLHLNSSSCTNEHGDTHFVATTSIAMSMNANESCCLTGGSDASYDHIMFVLGVWQIVIAALAIIVAITFGLLGDGHLCGSHALHSH
jgi:hypothetical protein